MDYKIDVAIPIFMQWYMVCYNIRLILYNNVFLIFLLHECYIFCYMDCIFFLFSSEVHQRAEDCIYLFGYISVPYIWWYIYWNFAGNRTALEKDILLIISNWIYILKYITVYIYCRIYTRIESGQN